MPEKAELLKNNTGVLVFCLFWFLSIAVTAVLARESDLAMTAVFAQLVVFFLFLRAYLQDHKSLKDVCAFYEGAHSLDDLQLMQSEKPYARVLATVVELGKFDWAVLFLMDYEKDCFVAVEAAGVKIERFNDVSFDDITTEKSADGVSLTLKLLEHAFKLHEFRGALAGTALGRNNAFYGCLLVGRHDADAELTSEDSFRLDILSDQISICLHNFRLHKELAMRAEEMADRQLQIQRELDMARIVQDGVMPRQPLATTGIKVASFLRPARFIGGDFLRYVDHGSKDRLSILIGDVCGKGVPAALVMAVVVCLFKEKSSLEIDPAALMTTVNLSLKEFLGAGSHFNSTAVWGVLDLEKMQFCYASAGHDFPLLFSAKNGQLTELPSTGTLLGIFAESTFQSATVTVEYGDRLLFYSDGLIDFFEAQNECGDGYIYLQRFFADRGQKTSAEIVKEISTLVENSPASIKDDITVAVFSIEKEHNLSV